MNLLSQTLHPAHDTRVFPRPWARQERAPRRKRAAPLRRAPAPVERIVMPRPVQCIISAAPPTLPLRAVSNGETTWRTGETGANAVILRSRPCPLLTTCSSYRIKRIFASASRSREGFHAGDNVASLPTPSIARARWCRVVPCRKPVWGVPGRGCAGTKPLGFTCAPVDVPGAAPLGEIADRRGRRLRARRHSSHAGDCRKRDRHCRMRQGCRR